jgi:hypothetical protein
MTLLTVLNFSGGRQSTAILHMVLRGEIEVDRDAFIVLTADPGMEAASTYNHVAIMHDRCRDAGIHAVTVPGPNLYEDLLSPPPTRIDSPPYWTKNPDGSRGRLMQKCTRHYKVAPMDRYIRRLLEDRHGIPVVRRRLPAAIVEKWIGFSYDEVMRIKPPRRKYITFRYPLIDLKMGNAQVGQYYHDIGEPVPARSVCNACFANGRDAFVEMQNRPDDWRQALLVDDAIRRGIPGVNHPCFVSKTLLPLVDLVATPAQGRLFGDQDGWSCDSGYCFT